MPRELLHKDLVYHVATSLQFPENDSLGGHTDVVRGAHGGICRSDDGHEVESITVVNLIFLSQYRQQIGTCACVPLDSRLLSGGVHPQSVSIRQVEANSTCS